MNCGEHDARSQRTRGPAALCSASHQGIGAMTAPRGKVTVQAWAHLFEPAEADQACAAVAAAIEDARHGLRVGMGATLRRLLIEPVRLYIGAKAKAGTLSEPVQAAEALARLAGALAMRFDQGATFGPDEGQRVARDLRAAWGRWIETGAGHYVYHHAAQAAPRARMRVKGIGDYHNVAGEALTPELLRARTQAAGGRRPLLKVIAAEFQCSDTYVSELFAAAGLKDARRGRKAKG